MAAEVLADAGVSVTVVEHMRSPGRKFLLAGRGGLNLTHSEPPDGFLARYGPAESLLRGAVESFSSEDLREWAASLGQPTFVGSSGRVFPEAFRATPLLRAWLTHLTERGVGFLTRHRWVGWGDNRPDGAVALRFTTDDATTTLTADVAVLALGGASWPRTGSDAGWVQTMTDAEISVVPLRPSNVGVRISWSTHVAHRFAGDALKNVEVSMADGGPASRGDVMITSSGLEGGPIYALSPGIRHRLDADGSCGLVIDLAPDRRLDEVSARLGRRRPKDSMSSTLRRTLRLSPAAIGVLREATHNRPPDDPSTLAALVKSVPVEVTATMPIDRAISSAGGISFDEVDETFMLRRRPGTFVAGEMLDWEAPTGGYLLQATFSTGVAAARGALARLSARHRIPRPDAT